jgi:hypothetical protein
MRRAVHLPSAMKNLVGQENKHLKIQILCAPGQWLMQKKENAI